jgi:glutathione S-transferase
MIKLYDFELSGNCYKIRLFLSILGIEFELEPIEFYPGKEHKSDVFLRINPLGQLPVLVDDGIIYRDSQAILVYLAAKYDKSGCWYPTGDPQLVGQMQMWLGFAESLTNSISAARLHDVFMFDFDVIHCRNRAHELLAILDEHLWMQERQGRGYLCDVSQPTIADLACFPYIALSDEGGVSLLDYPAVRRWCDRVKRIPGFVVMAGVFPVSEEFIN